MIAPDAGALTKVQNVAKYFGLELLSMNKARDYSQKNKVNTIQLSVPPEMARGRNVNELLRGLKCIIVDDMADTCGTVIAAIEKLKSYGAESCIGLFQHRICC